MNIFFLDKDPIKSARAMTNKHVVKMILETAQLLSTAHHILDEEKTPFKDTLYKKTHVNHPSAVWVRESSENYYWAYDHFKALCIEYNKRYHKIHMTETKLDTILKQLPKNIKQGHLTPIKLAITNKDFHFDDPYKSYRTYYEQEKLHLEIDKQRYHDIIGSFAW